MIETSEEIRAKNLPIIEEVMVTEANRFDRMTADWVCRRAETVNKMNLDNIAKKDDPAHFRVPGQYLYEDLLLGSGIPPSRMAEIRDMDIRKDDVIIASYPKTGTTLLQEMVWLISNHGDVKTANELYSYERVLFIEFTKQQVLDSTKTPRHFKTHIPHRFLPKAVQNLQTKTVYIMRNPKDVLVSYYHFYRMCIPLGNYKGTWNDFFQMFVNNDGKLYYGNMFDHMLAYWHRRHDANLHIVFYEDIVRKPKEKVQEIARFLEKSLTNEEVDAIVEATSFETMRDNPITNWSSLTQEVDISICPFMRRGIVGDWRTHFTHAQNELFDRMISKKFDSTGLEFTYE